MRKLSLQWRLTILTTVLITVLCGCLTFFVTVQHPVKGTLIFGQNRENKISVSSLL